MDVRHRSCLLNWGDLQTPGPATVTSKRWHLFFYPQKLVSRWGMSEPWLHIKFLFLSTDEKISELMRAYFPAFLRYRQAHVLQPVKLSGSESLSDLRLLKHHRADDDDHQGADAPSPASSMLTPAFRYIRDPFLSFKLPLLLFLSGSRHVFDWQQRTHW